MEGEGGGLKSNFGPTQFQASFVALCSSSLPLLFSVLSFVPKMGHKECPFSMVKTLAISLGKFPGGFDSPLLNSKSSRSGRKRP